MPESSRPKIVVAFDYGLRRIGVACGDTVSRSASALETVPAEAKRPALGVDRFDAARVAARPGGGRAAV